MLTILVALSIRAHAMLPSEAGVCMGLLAAGRSNLAMASALRRTTTEALDQFREFRRHELGLYRNDQWRSPFFTHATTVASESSAVAKRKLALRIRGLEKVLEGSPADRNDEDAPIDFGVENIKAGFVLRGESNVRRYFEDAAAATAEFTVGEISEARDAFDRLKFLIFAGAALGVAHPVLGTGVLGVLLSGPALVKGTQFAFTRFYKERSFAAALENVLSSSDTERWMQFSIDEILAKETVPTIFNGSDVAHAAEVHSAAMTEMTNRSWPAADRPEVASTKIDFLLRRSPEPTLSVIVRYATPDPPRPLRRSRKKLPAVLRPVSSPAI